MIRRITLLAFILMIASISFSQINHYGVSEIKNYPHSVTKGTEQNWSIAQDLRGVIYVGNNDKGILEYDGSEWRNISVSNERTIRSLVTAPDGTVFVGAFSEIGFLSPDIDGDLQYQSLLPLLDTTYHNFTNIWKTFSHNDKIYFCSERYILIFSPESKSFNVISAYNHTLFCFLENEKLYCGAFLDGLVELQGDSIVKSKGGEYYAFKNIFALTAYDENNLLIGTPQSGLSLYNTETGKIDSTFASRATNQYIKEHFIYHLLKLPSDDFLISTATGGLAVVSNDGELLEIISKPEGLQDQTVYSSFVNSDNYPYPPVWSALDIGVAKTQFNAPLKTFTTDFGFQGQIMCISSIDEQLYIGTNSGLFTLNEIKGKNVFSQVGEIKFSVWEFQKFKLGSGENVLLAITNQGIYQISKNGRIVHLDFTVQNRFDPKESTYWGFTISKDPNNPNRIILARETSINVLILKNGIWYEEFHMEKLEGEKHSLEIDDQGDIWYGTKLAEIGKISLSDSLAKHVLYGDDDGLPAIDGNSISRIGDELLFGTKDGIYRFNAEENIFIKDTVYNPYLPSGQNWVFEIHEDQEGCFWISFENRLKEWKIAYLQPEEGKYKTVYKPFSGLPKSSSTDAFHSEKGGSMWFSKSNILYHYQKGYSMLDTPYRTLVRKVTIGTDSVIYNGAYPLSSAEGVYKIGDSQDDDFIPHIKHSDNNVEFRWSSPYFDQEDKLEYSYYLVGFSSRWSEWEKVVYQDFTNLPHGTYNFRIKARNVYMDESLEDSFTFIILRPLYLTIVAFLIYLLMAVAMVYIIIALYTRRLKNENIRLEGIIQERTAEIRKQKEELTDSIEYASRIQRAMLPPDNMLDQHVLDHFILFRPRDIVSGDFYWIGTNKDKVFIVAADCTGHGVPGAFMSMLGISFLDEIVIKSGVTETNKILDALRQHIITSLRQTGKGMFESTRDGMDLAMISIDNNTKAIQYSGAYNPLYSIRNLNEQEKAILSKGDELELERGDMHNDTHILFQVKADPMPIGISEKEFNFTAKSIKDEKSSTIYLFSDGYVDQFGGPNGKKLMSKNFKKLLLEIQGLSMEKQHATLDQKLVEWMGDISQIDDVLVIGIKLGQ